jgi:ketosteroid isomerase-like protein
MVDVPEPIATYFRSVNTRDWESLATVFTDDAEVRPVGQRPRVGRAEVLEFYPWMLSGYAEHHDEVTRVVEAGDTVVTEIAFKGNTSGGRPVAFEAVDVFDLANGRIRRVSIWFDTAGVYRQVRGS